MSCQSETRSPFTDFFDECLDFESLLLDLISTLDFVAGCDLRKIKFHFKFTSLRKFFKKELPSKTQLQDALKSYLEDSYPRYTFKCISKDEIEISIEILNYNGNCLIYSIWRSMLDGSREIIEKKKEEFETVGKKMFRNGIFVDDWYFSVPLLGVVSFSQMNKDFQEVVYYSVLGEKYGKIRYDWIANIDTLDDVPKNADWFNTL